MILGIGIDSIEIERFAHWKDYAHTTLGRIFSPKEIAYCLSVPNKSAERFAARFAAREAFYKALCGLNIPTQIPFLRVCKTVQIEGAKNGPQKLIIDWPTLFGKNRPYPTPPTVHLSLSHNKTTAFALVILETSRTQ